MNDTEIEQEIQAKGLTAPRVTPADVEASILYETYFSAGDGVVGQGAAHDGDLTTRYPVALDLVTICVLILKNGTKVVGVNEGPVSAENFSAKMGREIARRKALDQIWPMLGYELRSQLAEQEKADPLWPC